MCGRRSNCRHVIGVAKLAPLLLLLNVNNVTVYTQISPAMLSIIQTLLSSFFPRVANATLVLVLCEDWIGMIRGAWAWRVMLGDERGIDRAFGILAIWP